MDNVFPLDNELDGLDNEVAGLCNEFIWLDNDLDNLLRDDYLVYLF